jgi:hypothetical protein
VRLSRESPAGATECRLDQRKGIGDRFGCGQVIHRLAGLQLIEFEVMRLLADILKGDGDQAGLNLVRGVE